MHSCSDECFFLFHSERRIFRLRRRTAPAQYDDTQYSKDGHRVHNEGAARSLKKSYTRVPAYDGIHRPKMMN